MIRFESAICTDLAAAESREWLETNGLGGFASSTITGLNTRRYHGLLVAAIKPPVERFVLLSKLEETLVVDGKRYELSTNRYPGAIHPEGFRLLSEFRLDPFPVFVYEAGGVVLQKSVFMVSGQNTTVVEYSMEGPKKASLEINPLIAFRDYHSLTHENGSINPGIESLENTLVLHPYDSLPKMYLSHNAVRAERAGHWYRNFEYAVEKERGLDFREDLFNPVTLFFEPSSDHPASMVISTEAHRVEEIAGHRKDEIRRRKNLLKNVDSAKGLGRDLMVAADQFIVARASSKTVIAGYHWFSDWGRDTMISLPGLTLATGRIEEAKSILMTFASHVDHGMLPNRFPDAGETPEYNTIDASLWYFEAIRALIEATGDSEFVRSNLYEVLKDMMAWHIRGTRYGIQADSDGLLKSGDEGAQCTWMDARVDGRAVTPRCGKPVEIQALWYNALCVMANLARQFGDEDLESHYRPMAALVSKSFHDKFWNPGTECLYDTIDDPERDGSIRPNQIFAVSLHHALASGAWARKIVDVVERDLLTPYGLRTLSPRDPRYRGRYLGDPATRDGSYHQGTVWAWLMGPFVSAYLKAHDQSMESQKRALNLLEGFTPHLSEAGLGQISEIFDGDPPYTPRGCIAQAWSVAEILRAIKEMGAFRK